MIFSSHEFVLVFLPVVYLLYRFALKFFHTSNDVFLVLISGASLVFYFYGSGELYYVIILSILVNYAFYSILSRAFGSGRRGGAILAAGILFNLGLIVYYKYANFFIDVAGDLGFQSDLYITVSLPLAISFFTFQQIAFLVDHYKGQLPKVSFLRYVLFVSFFPQLIAGPIVHWTHVIGQMDWMKLKSRVAEDFCIGITIFTIGLAKKVLIADTLADYADASFGIASDGNIPSLFEAWSGSIAYTLQIYFDFSGYSDMAVGLARMFGIKLPVNFFSPYRATSITDFWRRWNMTLSSFLRDYLYIPLGGNRAGVPRTLVNLVVTMLLAGLWHGAGWTFIVWGALHGFLLLLEKLYRKLVPRRKDPSALQRGVSWFITIFVVSLIWVFFRAENLDQAWLMFQGMFGFGAVILPKYYLNVLGPLGDVLRNGIIEPVEYALPGLFGIEQIGLMVLFVLISALLPNTYEFMRDWDPVIEIPKHRPPLLFSNLRWAPTGFWVVVMAAVFIVSIYMMGTPKEFIYFEF